MSTFKDDLSSLASLLEERFPLCKITVNRSEDVGTDSIDVYFPSIDTNVGAMMHREKVCIAVVEHVRSDYFKPYAYSVATVGNSSYRSPKQVVKMLSNAAKGLYAKTKKFEDEMRRLDERYHLKPMCVPICPRLLLEIGGIAS